MQTYYDNYLNMAKPCLKVLKDNCRRLESLSLEAFACVEVSPLGHDGSVLLTVLAQALLLTIVCMSLPSLFSGNAVDDCQWEVHAYK
jgi:hypothetical protein